MVAKLEAVARTTSPGVLAIGGGGGGLRAGATRSAVATAKHKAVAASIEEVWRSA